MPRSILWSFVISLALTVPCRALAQLPVPGHVVVPESELAKVSFDGGDVMQDPAYVGARCGSFNWKERSWCNYAEDKCASTRDARWCAIHVKRKRATFDKPHPREHEAVRCFARIGNSGRCGAFIEQAGARRLMRVTSEASCVSGKNACDVQ